jgi:uncharacterized Zn-finger protein
MSVTAPAQEIIKVKPEDLPIYCPGPQAPQWSMHPRVFLDVAHTGSARCAYCGAQYMLQGGPRTTGH